MNIPIECMEIILRHCDYLTEEMFKRALGLPTSGGSDLFLLAASAGFKNIMKWLYANGHKRLIVGPCSRNAASNGHSNVLSWMLKIGRTWDPVTVVECASKNGHLNVLEQFSDTYQGTVEELLMLVTENASAQGKLEVIVWALNYYSGGIESVRKVLFYLCSGLMCEKAIKCSLYGNAEILQYMKDEEYVWSRYDYVTAAKKGCWEVIDWVVNNCSIDNELLKSMIVAANSSGNDYAYVVLKRL